MMSSSASAATPFSWPVRVYWEDTDAGGIVFYANYLKFFERARTEWLRSLGLEQRHLKDTTGGMFVVSDTQVRYHRPAKLDDELIVTARPTEVGRASLTIHQQAWLKTPTSPILLCEGTIRAGWINAISYKPTRIPPTLFEAFTP
jgi:acyl-CoA thioester hydrolase